MSGAGYPDPGFSKKVPHPALPRRRSVDPGFSGGKGVTSALTRPRHPAQPRGARPSKMYDPFAPVTQQQVQTAGNVFGPVLSNQQIQHTAGNSARALITPQLHQIEDEINRREQTAQANLAATTAGYARQAAQYAPQAAQAYGQAEQSQAQVNNALAQALSGGGDQAASELGAKLAQINAPAPYDVGAMGHGAANASLATGSAELSRLLAEGAHAQDYGAKLPGIAANAGSQRAGQLGGEYADQLRTANQGVQSQLPSLIQGIVGDLTSTNEARRQNRAGAINSAKDRATNAAVFRKEYGLKDYNAHTDRKRIITAAAHNKRADAARANANSERVTHDAATEQNATTRANNTATANSERARHDRAAERQARISARAQGREIDPALSAQKGIVVGKDGKPILQYHLDSDGKRIPGTGRKIPYRAKRAGKGKSGKSASGL